MYRALRWFTFSWCLLLNFLLVTDVFPLLISRWAASVILLEKWPCTGYRYSYSSLGEPNKCSCIPSLAQDCSCIPSSKELWCFQSPELRWTNHLLSLLDGTHKYRHVTHENSSNLAVIRELMVQPEAWFVKCPKLFTWFVIWREKDSWFVTGTPPPPYRARDTIFYDYRDTSAKTTRRRVLARAKLSQLLLQKK